METNKQKPESYVGAEEVIDGTLDVVNIWRTVQGEGPYAGCPAVFVRLAGCNLRCPMCDTDYTTNRQRMSPLHILNQAWLLSEGMECVLVITGGEPYRQDFAPLLIMAKEMGWTTQVETNGTFFRDTVEAALAPTFTTVVCSPKTSKLHPDATIHALKYVVAFGETCPEDGLPLTVLGKKCKVARPPEDMHPWQIYVQPLDEQNTAANHRHTQEAVKVCNRFGYRLCLQVHKLVGLD